MPQEVYTGIIEIVGNSGSGKTTLATSLAESLQGTNLDLDQFVTNPFLDLYTQDPKRWAFTVGASFAQERAKQIPQVMEARRPIILDQGFDMGVEVYSRASYRRGEMNQDEWQTLQQVHTQLMQTAPTVDTTIFLDVPTEELRERIVRRGRPHEQAYYNTDYLSSLDGLLHEYVQWLREGSRRQTIITINQNGIITEGQPNPVLEEKLGENLRR